MVKASVGIEEVGGDDVKGRLVLSERVEVGESKGFGKGRVLVTSLVEVLVGRPKIPDRTGGSRSCLLT